VADDDRPCTSPRWIGQAQSQVSGVRRGSEARPTRDSWQTSCGPTRECQPEHLAGRSGDDSSRSRKTKALTMPGDDRFRLHDTSALRHSVHARESHTQRRRVQRARFTRRLPEQPGVTSHRVSRQPSVLADRSTIANAFPQELFRRKDYRRVRPADFARDDDGQALTMVWRPRRAGTFCESDCGDFADRRPRSLLRAE
jgi:hypothetical protein